MDVSAYDRTPDSTIVDLRETTSCSSHSDSLPVQSNNRTSVPGNIPIDTTNRIYIRSRHNDSDKLSEIDVSTTAANIASVPEGCLWCWSGACTHTHPAGHHHQVSECTGGTHIFFNDCISSEDYRGSGNCRFHDTCDSGINTTSETTEILCDYASVCDDESIYIEAPSSLVCAEDRSKLLDNELASCQKTDRLTAQSEDHKESHVVSSLTPGSAQRDSITTVSEALVGERTCSTTMPISTVAAVYITSLLNQTSKMSECLLPANRDFIHDVQQPSSAVCIPPSQFSPLVSTDPSALPPVSLPPIFYINMDETLPLNVCVTEKQNAVLKSELANVNPRFPERCDSQLSTFSEKQDICRICHCEGDLINKLISPCLCSGSLKYIHLCCLQKWIKSSDKKSCELCNFDYFMTMKIRPFKQWERLDMTVAERRKIVCSVTFHVIAITCVIWSLYVLIDRTTEEVNAGTLDWPFWTKLIVVAIGFTGGLVFMYVQCKMYLQLCLRWRQYNKLINIENAPEDLHVRAEAAARIKARSNEAGGVVNTVALQEVDSF